MTQAIEASLPALLRERASMQPDDTAYTFIDYDQDWAGVPISLTWPQLYRRVTNMARELRLTASAGDRAMIIAPQGLDYIVAFLGALHAGVIPVPLSVPMGGVTDERVESVLRDASPVAVLTTSAVVTEVVRSVTPDSGRPAPAIIEVDRLDLDAPPQPGGGMYEDGSPHDTAYLQYTSGSTRSPAGVMISYTNLLTNLQQITTDYSRHAGITPPDLTFVSWLPFFHDLGLILGVCSPIVLGTSAVLTSPASFLVRPARWMQLLATNPCPFTAAPNFAFDLATRKTSDDDMAGLDLGGVHTIQSGAERVQPATIKRFTDRFARFNLNENVIQPSYGMAEATLYMSTPKPEDPIKVVHFDSDALTGGEAKRVSDAEGTPLISYDGPISSRSPVLRIVDPETHAEVPEGKTGEIWCHGDNVSAGYWEKPEETARTFGATIASPSEGTPAGPWLRTGDVGFISEGELFVVGRIKDILIIYGRNHAPDDIEATVTDVTGGRCVAVAVPDDAVEKLVVVMEVRKRGDSEAEVTEKLDAIKRDVTVAISNTHGIAVADLVLVGPGSIPVTTSGKVRRQLSKDLYQRNQFTRVDA
ncbi:acyl-CoA synthetase [Mycolicibacterium aromaticivorans JS19b1 = JCM 16368]|uniref:Acyl-CoA synthetase n=1 Tax=Mycolicibacterium aromaticivorans JS19b1 = JCM 16368 TaxID=1440774 RepID=A0A064CQS5_9MYCO|nr:AMP-binding protein [Mycolicibacterium aromaticivorans]KDF01168.1 acyl-CoA synthetase [Mycolicibacterium aromaticivorans JS19b1 = JCM 16368]